MQESVCQVLNRKGLHARACAMISTAAQQFSSTITLKNDDRVADGKSLLKLLTLDAPQNTSVRVITEGDDEVSALECICQLFADKFNEDQGL